MDSLAGHFLIASPSILDPNAGGPPQSDAPPHVAQGMFAEFTVE